MVPELGHFALILAFCMALAQATFPLIGAARVIPNWIALARPAAIGQLGFLLISYGCLTYAFIVHDFSVAYVAQNSNTSLPLLYRVAAVGGGHEGSLLLWVLVLGAWTGAVTLFSRQIPDDMAARVIGVMGLVSIGFLLFTLLTSNPFDRLQPVPMDGRDLNPLLQDPGMAIHPPMLYMGYVGFSVAFAFAIAAMLSGRLDTAWARWSRPWTNAAWMFLTGGIALGSWWAYYELGWGGWWFWDPVENASFMPWLVGTALMHSLAVTEKRGGFKAWTLLLAILTFSLSLLGTFLVLSGVLTSVHAFAVDPARGVFILAFLGVVIGGSLLLYAIRAPKIHSVSRSQMVSRETALLLNNVFLVVAAASILLGTLYPLVIDALELGKISIGPPYFNAVFIPVMAPLALLVGLGVMARWKKDSFTRIFGQLRLLFILSVVIGCGIPLVMPFYSWLAAIGMVLALWVVLSALHCLFQQTANRPNRIKAFLSVPLGFYGMTVAHIGISVFIVGMTLTSVYSEEKDIIMAPGDRLELGTYTFIFEGVKPVSGPNYQADEGLVRVTRNDKHVATLKPQKRIYRVQQNPMTEAAIDAGVTRDLFVALGEPLGKEKGWSLRVYHKPFLRWIWMGAIFMGFGGFLAACDKRYRRVKVKQPAPIKVPAGGRKPTFEAA